MRATNPVDAVWPLIMFCFVVTILFVFVAWILMLIGLLTGFGKFSVDRKIIRIYNEGWQKQLFPNNYVPGMGYTPEIPPYQAAMEQTPKEPTSPEWVIRVRFRRTRPPRNRPPRNLLPRGEELG
jgi:uncharacterized protein (DUF58 family)